MQNNRRPVFVLILLGLMSTMIVAIVIGVAVTNDKYNRFATPGQHTAVWQGYKLHTALIELIDTAQRLRQGQATPYALIQRIELLRSAVAPLQQNRVFDYLPEPRPAIRETLTQIERLGREWNAQVNWQDTQNASRVAADIVTRLPAMLAPVNDVVVGANIAMLNQLDRERQELRDTFEYLAWLLLALGLGCIPLCLKLVRDHRDTQRLTCELGFLNQSLEQRVAERTQRLYEREALLRAILESSPSDVALIDAGEEHPYYLSPALLRQSGAESEQAFRLQDLFVEVSKYASFRQRLESQHRLDHWEARLGPNAPYWALLSARRLMVEGQPAWLVWSLDITERKRMEGELKRLASTDALTGLSNRRAFLRQSIKLLRRTARSGSTSALLVIDIDYFKQVNDRHGHQAGDHILRSVAELLRNQLDERVVIGRMGGEEFAVLLPAVTPDEAWEKAERLRMAAACQSYRIDSGETVTVTISIGISIATDANVSPKQLLVHADEALYRAKSSGRNRCVQQPVMAPQAVPQ